MPKPKPEIKIESCGLYTPLDREGKDLPKLIRFTAEIPCELGVEFGYILHIKKARGMKLTFEIDHPSIPDDQGNIRPPFTGEEYVRSNDWKFFLGDTTWEPIENKAGPWRIRSWLEGELIADRTLTLIASK